MEKAFNHFVEIIKWIVAATIINFVICLVINRMDKMGNLFAIIVFVCPIMYLILGWKNQGK
jgi:hypothetical protein